MNPTTEEKEAKSITAKLVTKGWDEHHADQVEYWLLQYYFNNEEFYNQNSLRIARSWEPAEVKEYEQKQNRGSGGAIDIGLSTIEGRTIRVGFHSDD
jgi:hypothetical protein